MRAITLAAVGVSGLALCACMPSVHVDSVEALKVDREPMRVAAALECPVEEGALVLTGRPADGQSCDYRRDDGETITLRRVALNGRPAAEALAPLRAELQTLVPMKSTPIEPVADDATPYDRVDLPFLHVRDGGGRSEVSILGVKIRSEDHRADIDVSKGARHTTVHAGAHGAEIIVDEVGRTNVGYVYVLARHHRPSQGYEAVGYVAKGPVEGPLVVAEFKAARDHDAENDRGRSDLDRLIDRNVKGA